MLERAVGLVRVWTEVGTGRLGTYGQLVAVVGVIDSEDRKIVDLKEEQLVVAVDSDVAAG